MDVVRVPIHLTRTGLDLPLVDDPPGMQRLLHIGEVKEGKTGMALGRGRLDPHMDQGGIPPAASARRQPLHDLSTSRRLGKT